MSKYNKTQLTPQQEFERHIYHRDQFAHYLRWSHIMKIAKIGMKILDFGCGSAEMLELFYRNKYRPALYYGLDVREKQIEQNREKFKKLDFAKFDCFDLCGELPAFDENFDIITCFEVMEHIGHENADAFLENMASACGPNTTIYLSTPNYDPQVGAANNHMIDGEVSEWDHFELQKKLEEYFTVVDKHGTFASVKDYKSELIGWKRDAYDALREYYDTNMLSVIMAPMIDPSHARNCLWVLRGV